MIEFKCQICGKFLKLPHSYAGKTTECPGCRRRIPVPGAAPAEPPAHAPRPKVSAGTMQLCVDCGRSFPAHQIMEHNGQAVCTDCFHKRKPVVLKYPKKRTKKRKWVLRLLILALLATVAYAVWHFFLR